MIEDRKNWVTGIFSTLTISTKVNNFEVIHFFFLFLTLAKGLDKVIRKKIHRVKLKKKEKNRSKKKTKSKGSNIQKIIPLSYSTKQYFFSVNRFRV